MVFEKARGVGGRTSTRRHETYAFDHGAQYCMYRGHADLQIGVCGDWTHGARVEDAFTSGKLLARAMLGEQVLPASYA